MKVAVIGAGEMGHGIAELFAIRGHEVSLCDVNDELLERARTRIKESLEKLHAKGNVEDVQTVFQRIFCFTDIVKSVEGCGVVIEAVPEKLEIKQQVFRKVEEAVGDTVLLATNTSNIRISEIAAVLKRKERMLGMHFFNPPVIMKLVEIIKGNETAQEYVEKAREIVKGLGKTPVLVNKDTPGFIVNRINAADLLYFGLLAQDGIDVAEVDTFMKQQGLPMGPYELIDFVGVDTVSNSMEYFSKSLSPDFGKCTIYGELVRQGRLGRKSRRGFYEWEGGKAKIPKAKPSDKVSLMHVFAIEINEAAKLMEEGVATAEDIENAVRLGMNRPFGPITAAKGLSTAEIKAALGEVYSRFQLSIFSPAKSIQEGKLQQLLQRREIERPAASNEGPILLERREHIAVITLNREPLNTINTELLDALERTLQSVAGDREIRVVLIRSNGKHFSAGAELSTFIRDAYDFIEYARRGERLFRFISEMPKITVAALKGYVLGGGLELALACDIRICSEDTKLGFPELTRGLVPAWGGSERLPRLIGLSRASAMILTGRTIDAHDALSSGLVMSIERDVDQAAMKLSQDISANCAPVAAMLAKKLLNKGAEAATDIGLEMEALSAGILFNTEDLREGISAFLQKRKAEFRGK
jgi:enoyl-CoA hydratase/3-hydroxyacyl-CoA dehydrogenase